MEKCKNCGKEVDKLHDEEICTTCHEIWLDNLLNDTDVMVMVRLNRYAQDIGLGGS